MNVLGRSIFTGLNLCFSVMDKAEIKRKVVYCSHCDAFVPRKTAYNHRKGSSENQSIWFPTQSGSIDTKRQKRCIESSDDEDNETDKSEDCNDADLDEEDENILDEDYVYSESENILGSKSVDADGRPQVWDEIDESDIASDVSASNFQENRNISCEGEGKVRKIILWILSSILYIQSAHVLSDKCFETLLTFIKQILVFLSPFHHICRSISKVFPGTLYAVRKFVEFDRDNFTKYVVCQNCYALYKYDTILVEVHGDTIVRKCTNLVFGCQIADKGKKIRKKGKFQCGGQLLRKVSLSGGKNVYYPLKVYCYKGIVDQLQEYLRRPHFVQECQKWRNRHIQSGKIADVYDGRVWKEFQESGFFDGEYNFAGMLNVDWFQPFKRRRDVSIGAIYLVLMNLPREKRYLRENVILVGILPCLHKEPESLTSFLKPLLDELKALWRGLDLQINDQAKTCTTRFALLCAAADIPAARKLCGFLGHSATQGCSHCTKKFTNSKGERSCGGFDVKTWMPRTKEEHWKHSQRIGKAKTLTQKKNMEKEFGYRYTVFLELDYFIPSRFLTIDPMHNLFLGTAKKMFSYWVDEDILKKKDLEKVTTKIKSLTVTSDVGRLPENIATNYGQFTAKEWKNWVIIYSMYVLQDLLPESDLKVWQTFVLACKHLCQPCICLSNIEIAHRLLMKFGTEVEKQYGSSFITPNMHMHCHLKQSLLDFGSVYGFWLFSFERYNGIMSGLPSNKRSLEIQFMRKFLQFSFVYELRHRDFADCRDFFDALIHQQKDSITDCENLAELLTASIESVDKIAPSVWSNLGLCCFKQESYELYKLNEGEKLKLAEMYSFLYGKRVDNSLLASFCKKFQSVYINRELYGSLASPKLGNYSMILATWADGNTNCIPTGDTRPSKVNNDSFKILEEVRQVAQSWAAGTLSLSQLLKDNRTLHDIKELLSNSVVSGMITSVIGVPGSELVNSLYSLNNIDQNQMSALANIAELVANYTKCVETDRFTGYATEDDLIKEAVKLHETNSFLAGIVFMNMEEGGSRTKRSASKGYPKHIQYKIRMDIENVRHTSKLKEMMWRPDPEDDMFDMRYSRGFIQLQDLIERSIISLQTGQPTHSPSVYLQQFPSPCHRDDRYLSYLSSYLLPVMMTIAWLAAIAVSTKNFVYDREIGQEEALKIMGLRTYLNWWAWFISTMLIMFIASVFCLLILRFGNLFRFTNFGILLLYFMDFCFSSIMLCYMVSSFFTRTTLAMLTVLIVYLLSYLPYIVLISMEAQMTFWQKTLACLFSTTSFGFGAQYLSRYEVQGVGVHWSNIQSTPIAGDSMSFSWTCIMMLIDGVIYLVIGWYVRNVKPGKYGVAQPWYFPLSPKYWGCTSMKRSKYATSRGNEVLFEPPMENWHSGITLKGLTKNYGKNKAVKNLNAEFYEGQVTALLGHNGAAKTTTLNMITGILDPSSGGVEIYGKDNRSSNKIGICTQHNTLFNYMTVMEHMQFYSSIKSDKSGQKMKLEIEELLRDVELWHVRYVRASDLSGGMQRRLCVALAFVGGSEAVILDEPTSGVDPSGRRCIWNLLYRRKYRCTILLSTHHLDEADIIGDRVAIMHNGQLMCSGSPLFLKQQLGSGYQLKIVKKDKIDVSTVLTIIKTWIPGAEITEDIGSEMTVSLPLRGVPMDNLYKCLFDLDSNADHLCIGNYGIYDTTMEEVFHKVCTLADKNVPITEETVAEIRRKANQDNDDDELSDKSSETRSTNGSQSGFTGVDIRKRVDSGLSQKLQQFTGLFIKRFHHYRRDWRMIFSLIILPCLFVLTALGFISIRPDSPDATQLILTPPLYGPNKYVFCRDGVGSNESSSLMRHLIRQPGIGTTCMPGMSLKNQFKCIDADTKFHTPANIETSPGSCKCEDFQQNCDKAARTWEVPFRKTNTTDILQKLDGLSIEDFLIKTASEYREMRYGGWSFEPDTESQDTTLKAKIWFNNKGHHAMPSFYNAFSNMLLRSAVNPANGDPSEYGITLYNHPLSLSKQQLNEDTLLESAADMGVALVFLVAFTFVPVGIMMYIVNEYKRKEKQLQFVSGVGPIMYWFTSFIWDALAFCLAVGLTVVIMAIFRGDSYWARDNLKAIVVLLLLYGWATIPWMYCTVKLFKDATSAYMVLFTFNMFVGITTMVIAFVLNFFQNQSSLKSSYEVVQYLFLIFPPYSLGDGLVKLITNQIQAHIFSQFGQDVYADPFSFDVLGWHLVALAIEGFVFAVLTLIIELRCSCCKSRLPRSLEEEIYKENEEVSNEKSRVLSGYAKDDLLTVSNLSKVYKRSGKEFLAVDHLTFGVPKAECFGLLGINGAGKTTTFRMLTGDLLPSYGAAHLKGHRISRGKSNLGQEVGYCPQEDALDLYLTGRELLHCHARLRGLLPEAREQAVDVIISKLKMTYADKVIKTYSGGMKRNLMVAVSLLGEPPVIFMDEPTTGMDPSTKRRVWNAVISSIKKGQSVVLTSHSMEECDALCTRLAIMVNGEFKCLGSPQQLKDRYGDGYTVLLHMCGLSTTKHPIADFIRGSFPGSIIRDQYQGVLQVDIPKGSTNVGNIICVLEREKQNYNITHYSVSQTTLDNVFLNFAREQRDGTKDYDHDSLGRTPSGSGSDSGSGTFLSSPFMNPTYAYMNPGFDSEAYDKTKFGSEHPSKLMVGPEHILIAEEDLITKL